MDNMECMFSGGSTKEEYINDLLEVLKSRYVGEYLFEYKLTDGLNGTQINNLIATDMGGREVFVIPVKDAYEHSIFKGFDEVFEIICHNIEEREKFYASDNMQSAVEKVLHPWLINRNMNKDLLQKTPHVSRGDYVVVFRTCPTFSNFQFNYGILSWEDFENYSLDPERVYNLAIKNVQDESLYKVMRFDNDNEYPDDVHDFSYREGNRCSKYVVQGLAEYCTNGSLYCESLWKKIGEMIGENYFVCPSSVHEWLIVPSSMATEEELVVALKERNEEMELEHVLGNEFYLYELSETHRWHKCLHLPFEAT